MSSKPWCGLTAEVGPELTATELQLVSIGVDGLDETEAEAAERSVMEDKVVGVLAVLGHASVAKVLLLSGSNSDWLERLRTEDQLIPRSSSAIPESKSVPG